MSGDREVGSRRVTRALLFVVALAQLVLVAGAQAVFSGANVRIAFSTDGSIHTVRPDGTGVRPLGPGLGPQWSPDGKPRTPTERPQVNLTAQVGGFAGGAEWQPLVRSSFKNSAEFCRALRDATGEASFKETYRTFGKSVSGN